MAMDQFLAEYYGTNKTASAQQEETEKQATVDLFLKLAAEQNIDLKSMPDADVQKLYDTFVDKVAGTKTAAEHEDHEKKEHEKKLEEAKKEHEEKHAMAKKAEEADAMGRIMAHSFFQEYRKIATDLTVKQGGELPPALAAHMKGKEHEDGKKEEHHEPPHHDGKKEEHEEKKASAIDDLAEQQAAVLAKEANFSLEAIELVKKKVAAVRTLGLLPAESVKVASAPNIQDAIGIRALELLEKAGFEVTWTEPTK